MSSETVELTIEAMAVASESEFTGDVWELTVETGLRGPPGIGGEELVHGDLPGRNEANQHTDAAITVGAETLAGYLARLLPGVLDLALVVGTAAVDGTATELALLVWDQNAAASGLAPDQYTILVSGTPSDASGYLTGVLGYGTNDTVTVLVPAGTHVGAWSFTPATVTDPWTSVDGNYGVQSGESLSVFAFFDDPLGVPRWVKVNDADTTTYVGTGLLYGVTNTHDALHTIEGILDRPLYVSGMCVTTNIDVSATNPTLEFGGCVATAYIWLNGQTDPDENATYVVNGDLTITRLNHPDVFAPPGNGAKRRLLAARRVMDAVTNTNTSLASSTAAFTSADVNARVRGDGIADGTTIDSVTNSTTVVLSDATTATATGATVTIIRPEHGLTYTWFNDDRTKVGRAGSIPAYEAPDSDWSGEWIKTFDPTSGGTVTTSDITGVATARILGRTTAGTGTAEELTASDVRTLLGLVVGTDVQAYDAELAALAGLTSAADKLPYFTGSGTAALADLSSFIRTLLDDADAVTARTTLGAASLSAVPFKAAVGDWVSNPHDSVYAATQTLNRTAYVPYLVPAGFTQTDGIAVEVTTVATSALCRLGIYLPHATTGRPDALVIDGGTVDFSSGGGAAGIRTLTITATNLTPGSLIYVSVTPQGATAASRHSNTGEVLRAYGFASSTVADVFRANGAAGFYEGSVTGALPSTATPLIGNIVGQPVVALRRS